jgi:threonine synthase
MAALATAHPAKFPESVEAAAGVTPVLPASVGDHSAKPERFDRLPADAEALKTYVRQFAAL